MVTVQAGDHPAYAELHRHSEGTLRAVVEHHQPHAAMSHHFAGQVAYWQCHGCDPGPYPEDHADWPCSTTELIAEQLGIPLPS